MTKFSFHRYVRHPWLALTFGLFALPATGAATAPRQENLRPPETAASQQVEAMRLYYSGLSTDDPPLLVLDADQLGALDQQQPDFAALGQQISRDGVTPPADTLARMMSEQQSRKGPYSEQLDMAHRVFPAFARLITGPRTAAFCLTVTANPDHDPAPALEGLSKEQKVRFFNRHEFWHCVGNRMGQQGGTDGYYDGLAEMLAEETRADAAALADMVALDGDDPGIITAVASWRARRNTPHYRSHVTTPALLALQTEIETMGVTAFRALSPAARRDLALRVAADNAVSAGALAQIDRLQGLTVNEQPLINDNDRAMVARLAAIYTRFRRASPVEPDGMIYLSPAAAAAARAWDAPARLAAAAAAGAEGTPQARLAAARVALLDGLRAEITADPANVVHGARIVLLENAYQAALTAMRQPTTARPAAPAT